MSVEDKGKRKAKGTGNSAKIDKGWIAQWKGASCSTCNYEDEDLIHKEDIVGDATV